MRWILVFLLLYIIPIGLLFKSNKNLKRCSIHASMYTVAVSCIIICNIYLSAINKMESILEYNEHISKEKSEEKAEIVESNKSNSTEVSKNTEDKVTEEIEEETETTMIEIENSINDNVEELISTDSEIIKEFKSEIYEIERKALIPMRECIPDMRNIELTPSIISSAKDDVVFAKNKCYEVIEIYEDMNIPKLSKQEYMDKLESSKNSVKNAYILRSKAMEYAEKLLTTKNLKYISDIKEYLTLSDAQIKDFVDTIKELQNTVDNN